VDDGTRATLVSQVAILTDHTDPSVRRTSLTILSRWTDDATYTPQLLAGLDDVDQSVRSSAAFALVDSRQSGEDARRGAILALKRMPLEPDERERAQQLPASQRRKLLSANSPGFPGRLS